MNVYELLWTFKKLSCKWLRYNVLLIQQLPVEEEDPAGGLELPPIPKIGFYCISI